VQQSPDDEGEEAAAGHGRGAAIPVSLAFSVPFTSLRTFLGRLPVLFSMEAFIDRRT